MRSGNTTFNMSSSYTYHMSKVTDLSLGWIQVIFVQPSSEMCEFSFLEISFRQLFFPPFGSCFTIVCRQLLDKITAEVYFRSLTFNQRLSPVHSVASGSILISPFSAVSSSERESTVQEKGRDYVALEVFVVLKQSDQENCW